MTDQEKNQIEIEIRVLKNAINAINALVIEREKWLQGADQANNINTLGLSVRAHNILWNILRWNDPPLPLTIHAVQKFSKLDILKMRNCGKKTLDEIVEALRSRGVELKEY